MSKDWDYAKLSHDVKVAGGVDVWVKTIKEAAYAQGSADTKNKLLLPVAVGCITIGALGQHAYHKLAPMVKAKVMKKKQLKKDAEEAEILLKSELETQFNEVEQPNNNVDILA